MGGKGTGSRRGATASYAFRRLADGGRNLPQALQSASLGQEGVGGGYLVPGGSLSHALLPSSTANDGMHALSAASKSAASGGLSWTAADAVVPVKVKKQPQPAALIKLEDQALDNGRRRAVAIALRHTLYPPIGPDKAAVLRAAYRTTKFARGSIPRVPSGEPNARGALAAVVAAEHRADADTAVVTWSRTARAGDEQHATAAAAVVADKVSGEGAAVGQADAGGGDARGGAGGVSSGAGGGLDGANNARAATAGAAGAVADDASGRGRGGHDGGHGRPRASGDAEQAAAAVAMVAAKVSGKGAADGQADVGGGDARGGAGGVSSGAGGGLGGANNACAATAGAAGAVADDASGRGRGGHDGGHGRPRASGDAEQAAAAVAMVAANVSGKGAADGQADVGGGDARGGAGGAGMDAEGQGRGSPGGRACGVAAPGAAAHDVSGAAATQPDGGLLHPQEVQAAAAAAIAGGRDVVAVPGFRFFGPAQVAAAVAEFAGVGLPQERRLRLTRAVALAADQNDLTGNVAVDAHEEDVAQSLLRHCLRTSCGRIPFGIRWRVLAFLRAQQ